MQQKAKGTECEVTKLMCIIFLHLCKLGENYAN